MKKLFFLSSLTLGLMVYSSNEAFSQTYNNNNTELINCYYPTLSSSGAGGLNNGFTITNISGQVISGEIEGFPITFVLANNVPFLEIGMFVHWSACYVVSTNCNGMLRMTIGIPH